MFKTVIVTIATSPMPFVSGTVSGGIDIAITGMKPQRIESAPYVATFSGVAPGEYTATAQALDSNGVALGPLVTSDKFAVVADMINIDVPTSITVSMQ